MSASPDRLFDLLPLIYRMRDAQLHYPLRDFLRVPARQVNAIEADIARLYDNWFIETCDDWVVPYLGDLLGYRLLPEAATLDAGGHGAQRLGRVLAPRSDVANTIGARRRKGTLSLLEDLARDAADWPARAVEFYRQLGWMQHLGHLRPGRGGWADLRDPGPLQTLVRQRGALDPFAHVLDVRTLTSHRGRGRHSIPSVGLFVFRLRSYPVSRTQAYCVESSGPHCYSVSVLGNDTPLYRRPRIETDPTHIAEEADLPVPLRRHRFAQRCAHDGETTGNAGPDPASPADADDRRRHYRSVARDVYGEMQSLAIYAPDWPSKGQGLPVPSEQLLPADLTDWHYQVPRGRLAVDPERGRLAFPVNQRPRHGVWVSYRHGFAGDVGGGEYARAMSELENARRYIVHAPQPEDRSPPALPAGHYARIADALAAWVVEKDAVQAQALQACKAAHPDDADAAHACALAQRPRALIIELAQSGVYDGGLELQLEPGEAIQIRAAERTRPVLRLLDLRASQPDAMTISGGAGSRVLLDGLLIAGRGIEVQGPHDDNDTPDGADGAVTADLCELLIRHCTLVPGWTLDCDCTPKRPREPSIVLSGTRADVRIEHSIVGTISVAAPVRRGEPPSLSLCDSVLDATSIGGVALGAPDEVVAHVDARFVRCTVIGEVQAHSVVLAEDSIFASPLRVLRRQRGCVRFSHVPTGSRTPRRFQCQPDLAVAAIPANDAAQRQRTRQRVVPMFMSTRYGHPDYMRLADACCIEIRTGASDRSAMGVWHHLYEPQREASLLARLHDSIPAGTDAGLIFAS